LPENHKASNHRNYRASLAMLKAAIIARTDHDRGKGRPNLIKDSCTFQ
jgi:hypothetical protein